MNEVLEVIVMVMLVFLESLSPSLDENFGLVTPNGTLINRFGQNEVPVD